MFNKTEIKYGGPSRIEHIEYRAPTDDSVKLLREMEEKARSEVIKSIKLTDINGGDVVLTISREPMTDEIIYRAIFKIMGNAHEIEHRTPVYTFDLQETIVVVVDKVARKLAVEMLMPVFLAAHRHIRP